MTVAEKVSALSQDKARLLLEAQALEQRIEQLKAEQQRKATIDRVREQLHRTFLVIDQKTRDLESLAQLKLF